MAVSLRAMKLDPLPSIKEKKKKAKRAKMQQNYSIEHIRSKKSYL